MPISKAFFSSSLANRSARRWGRSTADELCRAVALTALADLEKRFLSRRCILAAPASSRRACRRFLARHVPGDPPGAALFRDRVRSRSGARLPAVVDHPADLLIHAAVQQPGRRTLDLFSRARPGAAACHSACAQLFVLRAADQYDS